MFDLSETVIVITGAAGGLGRAYSEYLARLGARLAMIDIDSTAAERGAEALRLKGSSAIAFEADVANRKSVGEATSGILAAFGRIDVLVNNAGGNFAPRCSMEDISDEQWARTLGVNLTGTWLCIQAVAPVMKGAGRGKIINVSTTIASQGFPSGLAAYSSAKGGIDALTRTLAREFGPHGISVNAVAPGLIPMDKAAVSHARAAVVEALVHEVVSRQAIGRVGVPQDLCGMLAFLASHESDFITGQILNVDGGCAMG